MFNNHAVLECMFFPGGPGTRDPLSWVPFKLGNQLCRNLRFRRLRFVEKMLKLGAVCLRALGRSLTSSRRRGVRLPLRLPVLLEPPPGSGGGMMRSETLIELNFLDSSFSSSNPSIRAFRAYPLIEIRQAVPCRAVRGTSISVNSTR